MRLVEPSELGTHKISFRCKHEDANSFLDAIRNLGSRRIIVTKRDDSNDHEVIVNFPDSVHFHDDLRNRAETLGVRLLTTHRIKR